MSMELGQPQARKRLGMPLWLEVPLTLLVALLAAILIKAFIAQAFYIPSESMEPGFVVNDRILVQKWSYWRGEPQRGDIVVFQDRTGWLPDNAAGPQNFFSLGLSKVGLYPTGGHLVKRVIGVTGDVIKCCDRKGRLLLNGVPLNEKDYVKRNRESPCNGPMPDGGKCKWQVGPIPEGRLFVMGDNRGNSGDSSVHLNTKEGPYVAVDDVVGRVWVLMWPFNRFETVDRPQSFADLP
jgi:signal peptidase I